MNRVVLTILAFATLACSLSDKEIFARAVGPCIADSCQSKHSCYFGQCVPAGIAPAMPRLKVEDSTGPCLNGMCPESSFCHQSHCYDYNQ